VPHVISRGFSGNNFTRTRITFFLTMNVWYFDFTMYFNYRQLLGRTWKARDYKKNSFFCWYLWTNILTMLRKQMKICTYKLEFAVLWTNPIKNFTLFNSLFPKTIWCNFMKVSKLGMQYTNDNGIITFLLWHTNLNWQHTSLCCCFLLHLFFIVLFSFSPLFFLSNIL